MEAVAKAAPDDKDIRTLLDTRKAELVVARKAVPVSGAALHAKLRKKEVALEKNVTAIKDFRKQIADLQAKEEEAVLQQSVIEVDIEELKLSIRLEADKVAAAKVEPLPQESLQTINALVKQIAELPGCSQLGQHMAGMLPTGEAQEPEQMADLEGMDVDALETALSASKAEAEAAAKAVSVKRTKIKQLEAGLAKKRPKQGGSQT